MKANEGGRVKQHAAWRQGQWRGLRHAVCLPQALPATSEKWEPSLEMSDPDIWRIYLYDLCTSEMHLVSVDDNDDELDGDSTNPAVSPFGRFIAFENNGDTVTHVFVRDRGPQPLGDLNGDGVVDEIDKEILEFNWGACPCCASDLNGDGVVDQADRSILLAHLGDNTCNWVLTGEE